MKVEVHHYVLSVVTPPLKTAKIDEVEIDDAVLNGIAQDLRLHLGVRPVIEAMGYRVRFFSSSNGVVQAIVGDVGNLP